MFATLLTRHTEMTRHIEMLDALYKYATEGIVVVNKEGVIVMLNPKALEIFGYNESELPGKKIECLIPSRLSKSHVSNRDEYSANPHARGMGGSLDLFAKRKDGSEFPVEISLSPFKTSEGEFIMSFVIDITERKKHEDIIREANQQIHTLNAELEERVNQRTQELAKAISKVERSQAEVMRALQKEKELNNMKSQFVTVASHEFRTPLATILSSASLIGKYPLEEDEPKRLKHIQRIKSAVTNLTEILNDFLSIGKLEEGRIHSVTVHINLPEFLQSILSQISLICKEGQKIQYAYEGPSEAWVDNQLLRNVLLNLLSNAIKYSEPNTSIHFTILNSPTEIQITVRDEGMGIPEKDQLHIFDRFFRADNAGNIQGTGLGLNIVKNYVDLMKGTISFTSNEKKGTIFQVHIPNQYPINY